MVIYLSHLLKCVFNLKHRLLLIIKMDPNPLIICAIALGVFGVCFILCCKCYSGRYSHLKPSAPPMDPTPPV